MPFYINKYCNLSPVVKKYKLFYVLIYLDSIWVNATILSTVRIFTIYFIFTQKHISKCVKIILIVKNSSMNL